MNDPGLNEPISDGAKDVENRTGDDGEREGDVIEEEDEQDFLEPSRWWLASTAFPLIAGTFGPMASAFSICALVVTWRVEISEGKTEAEGIRLPDSSWLIGINAAQLAIALISNLFLLLNMARRVRFTVAQPVTIIGWYISSFALTGLCASVSGPLRILPKSSYALSQAFYYAIFSSGLYFLVASLMLITVWGASKGHYDKEFQLTMSQSTLMLQTISFLVYLLSGAAVFSHVEGWSFLDAVYWADFTLLTVGIGDLAPSTNMGRGLLFPFAIGGIIILGLVIGSIRSLVLERGKVKMGARMVEKERRRLIVKTEKKDKAAVLKPIHSDSKSSSPNTNRKINDTSASKQTQPLAHAYAHTHTSIKSITSPTTFPAEFDRRSHEFALIRHIQSSAHKRRLWTSLLISGLVWLHLWFLGALIFQFSESHAQNQTEPWTYFTSVYFAYTALLTIGYGDISPVSNAGKAFFVFWSLLAVPSLTILISNMGDTILKGVRDLTLWIGGFTVLPGEKGVKPSVREGLLRVTGDRWRVFEEEGGEDTQKVTNDDHQEREKAGELEPSPSHQRSVDDESRVADHDIGKSNKSRKDLALQESKGAYHVLLVQEIAKVMNDLKSDPPKEYTFEEWAWFLKLVGEDEGSEETHRKPLKRPDKDGVGKAIVGDGDETKRKDRKEDGKNKQDMEGGRQKVKWSWMGHRSPLMGSKDEAEWVLERLIRRLEKELQGVRREEMERKEIP
ncbi:related to potassium channel [Rhynchosporium secalis]|uniref:Related to potassium channel n=1 Tax=Rhynchosporium secalis TaxID=38038 RepID=A0A1E1M9R4_RHYSE|nr:related to potassium channel [Rhynchosporium secalis]